MKLEETRCCQEAHEAVLSLGAQLAPELQPHLKKIAAFLILAAPSEVKPAWFAWVGTGSPNDRAVVAEMNAALTAFTSGAAMPGDDSEDWDDD